MSKLLKVLAMSAIFASASHVQAQSASQSSLPPDIDPESYSRLPALTRDQLDPEGQRVYDLVVGDGPRPVSGPAAVSMYSPKVAEAFHILNQYLRYEGVLPPRYYEVAILHAAWEFEQAYEWSAHEPAARRVGVPDAVIDAIKYDRELEGLEKKDELVIRLGRALFRDHKVDSALYAEVVEHFGQQGLVELVTIMGDYVMAGLVLTAVDQHLPPGRTNTLPER